DRNFYDHFGIDIRGVARAAYVDLVTWSRRQGASTLTIQLAEDLIKNDHLPYRFDENISLKSFQQKFWEVVLALQIEKHYTKNEILEIYLNQVFLGGQVHGV